jgi:thioesterase DpgC
LEHLRRDMDTIYAGLTDGYRKQLRVSELVYAAAEQFPEQLPSRAAIDAERELLQKDKQGLEISQGSFVAHVLAHPRAGFHLMHSMSQPTAEALARLGEFERHRSRPDARRPGATSNTSPSESRVPQFRGRRLHRRARGRNRPRVAGRHPRRGSAGTRRAHHKYAGRRILGSGSTSRTSTRQISLVEFMLERELGQVSKMYRGHDLEAFDSDVLERRREKPWIAAVDTFAIGGTCQWLLVMDYVIAEAGSYFVLPARKEGIIPGCANLRLPRFVGERIARQAIFFNRSFPADSPEGLMLADEVVASGEMEGAIRRASAEVVSAGATSLGANRMALRQAQEPLDLFRRYMSNYSRQQARCLYSPALIDNLERNWNAKNR